MKFDTVKKDADEIKSTAMDMTDLKDVKFDCAMMKNDIGI